MARQPTEAEAKLATLPRNSPEWWALHDAIETEADGKLTKKLVICRSCVPQQPDARTLAVK